ncbi:MAG TPA: hypothetical protein EYQ25_08425 [Planctomycetes bacterium]|nr:hypothetical protein [Planctomycetota bacterium]HIL37195.1 hypothetical protein [Planctomycetota bacterium]
MFDKGDRVEHSRRGEGVVLKRLVRGVVRVLFDDEPGLPRTLHGSVLGLVGGPPPMQGGGLGVEQSILGQLSETDSGDTYPQSIAVAEESAPKPPRVRVPLIKISDEAAALHREHARVLPAADAWQTIEALRLGVVPSRGVQAYTVARNDELNNLRALLNDAHGCRVLWGEYGAGKTHLLEAAEQLALEQGMATARITLDPRENALHHPLRLYRRIADSIRTADQVALGFEGILQRLVDSPDHALPGGSRSSRFLTPYLWALRHGDPESIGWLRDYVRGDNVDASMVNAVLTKIGWRGQRVLHMSDYRTYGRMYVHLVGTLASWCADAGARGLVLLFDEVERVDALRPQDRTYAFEVLKHYAAVTMNLDDLAFDPESLYKGGQLVHREIPLRFCEDQPLTSIFALTPLAEVEEQFAGVTESTATDMRLSPFAPGLLGELVDRIAALYEHAYSDYKVASDLRENTCHEIADAQDEGHDSFRDAVRAAVALFDRERLLSSGRWSP